MRTETGRHRRMTLATALIALLLGAGLVACGGDESGSSGGQAERAFLEAMVPHHESAVEMARVAKQRAQHPEVRELARAIVSAQEREIAEMGRIHRRVFEEPLLPNMDSHAQLGLSAEEAGMMHSEDAAKMLRTEKPFDRAFIDAMIPHHQGAIRMARAVLDQGDDAEVLGLAGAIVRAQAQEIRQMNQWRADWYGAESPAGGVPTQGSMGGSGGEHEGH
jgi:uncharacterized protein (DUF305 family)